MVRKLVLHACDAGHALADENGLVDALRDIGLLGDAITTHPRAFYAGEEFLSLLTFLGCSPHVDLLPADEPQRQVGNFCHIRLHLAQARPLLRVATGKLRPRCPKCRSDVGDWQALVAQYAADETLSYRCPQCESESALPALNWRQSAGCGRWFVEVWNIHPHEAVPSERLLETMERVVGVTCCYFYE